MSIKTYSWAEDYHRIYEFLIENYGKYPANWPPPRWEYMHYHPMLNFPSSSRFGIWEDKGKIVGVAHHESWLGCVFFQFHPNYLHLKKEMLEYSMEKLPKREKGKIVYLKVHIDDSDKELQEMVMEKGLVKSQTDWEDISEFDMSRVQDSIDLPVGYSFCSLADETDYDKIDECLHLGFDHGDEPRDGDLDGRIYMHSAPNYMKDLNIFIKAPNGKYTCFAGMWFEPVNKLGYVEPVCTVPEYRRKGLGSAAVLESIRRVVKMGARKVVVGAGSPFYTSFGFKPVGRQSGWMYKI